MVRARCAGMNKSPKHVEARDLHDLRGLGSDASVWSGHCDDIPAAADAPTLDELWAKISAMTLDLLPDNHPDIDPSSVFLQITALREAEPAAA
jgi:hypothetical protein